ncbi:hypothetical protein OG875_04815 [Streptomyces sp. NBC_01498]|uniref:hypothetical protein n=1 Tax=Streptomyces sp. NBC_01498 TaxID=2975870 RepID=UPI002E7B585A|nr:hypothetical protein [Streptomyces sp. NBC_01498]WTL23978.1 hypothetical protein OG875_04815 [Streptomyces sp. NBC_01498]
MDLQTWITQQVDRAELTGRHITLVPDDGSHVISGTVADVAHGPDGLSLSVAQHGVEPTGDAATLRRCEADRRILNRHRLDPDVAYEPACKGCGTYGDQGLSNVDNLNDYPELLDLAHAHGITDDVLAGLDRPQPPQCPARPAPDIDMAAAFARAFGATVITANVPAALRGPNWKP